MSAATDMTNVVRPLYRVEYDALVEQGYLVDEPIELIEGRLLARSPEGDRHSTVIRRLTRLVFDAISADEGDIGVGNPIALSDLSEPEPDIAIFPPAATYRVGHPSTATLLIEVSMSSLRRDRIVKQRLYAQAGITDYWIVDLRHDQIIVHRDPADEGYRTVTHHRDGVLHALHHPTLRVDVGSLLR